MRHPEMQFTNCNGQPLPPCASMSLPAPPPSSVPPAPRGPDAFLASGST
jgi:hypothetical protein